MDNEFRPEEVAFLSSTNLEPFQAEVQDQQREARRKGQRFLEANTLRNSGFEQLQKYWETAKDGLNELQGRHGGHLPDTPRRVKENAYKGCAEEFADRRCALLLPPDVDKKSDEYKTLHELLRKWALNKLYSRDRELQDADAKKTAPPLTSEDLKDLDKRLRTALGVPVAPEPAKMKPPEKIVPPTPLAREIDALRTSFEKAARDIPTGLGTGEQVAKIRALAMILGQAKSQSLLDAIELRARQAAPGDKPEKRDAKGKVIELSDEAKRDVVRMNEMLSPPRGHRLELSNHCEALYPGLRKRYEGLMKQMREEDPETLLKQRNKYVADGNKRISELQDPIEKLTKEEREKQIIEAVRWFNSYRKPNQGR